MTYFKTISMILGVLMVLSGVFYFFFRGAYVSFVRARIYPEKRPAIIDLVCLVMIGILVYSWYRFINEMSGYALVICLLLSTSMIKVGLILFRYEHFRLLIQVLLDREKTALTVMNVCSVLLGAGLIGMTLTF